MYLQTAAHFPNDYYFGGGYLWGLHNTGQAGGTYDADIDAPEAWAITTGSQDVIIAVIDSGVDYTHPDLKNNVWINLCEFNGYSGVDDDENGFVDDIHGWDFVDNDSSPMDDPGGGAHGHGTHVAGIIAAQGDNYIGVTGVMWNGSIMPLRIFDATGAFPEPPYTPTSSAVQAINYAVNNGAHIINASWGGTGGAPGDALYYAIKAAGEAGVLFVTGAGNQWICINYPNCFFPASYPLDNIIVAAASDADDKLWKCGCYNTGFECPPSEHMGSNFGSTTVDIAAPGVAILSTSPRCDYDYYELAWGTSMSAAYISGLAGLLLSHNPHLTVAQLKTAIMDGVDSIGQYHRLVTGGRINAYTSLTLTVTLPEYHITLKPGWNLISLPLIPADPVIEVVLAGIMDYVIRVWQYDAETETWKGFAPGNGILMVEEKWRYSPPGPPDGLTEMVDGKRRSFTPTGVLLATLTEMVDGKGYWIAMEAAATLTVIGTEVPLPPAPPSAYPVFEGWNHIGFRSITPMPVEEYLGDTIMDIFLLMWRFDAAEGIWFRVLLGDNLEPGRGYWLSLSGNGTIYP